MQVVFKRLIAVMIVVSVALSCAGLTLSCGGSLKLEEISVASGSVQTEAKIGETLDFSGIRVTARYNDKTSKTLSFADIVLTFEGNALSEKDETVTQRTGTKKIEVSYKDAKTSFTVRVTDPDGSDEDFIVTGYENDVRMTKFSSIVSEAGSAKYGEAEYEGQFFKTEDPVYYAGDDNAFRYLPQVTVMDNETGEFSSLDRFRSVTTVTVKGETDDVTLTAKKGEEDFTTRYYDGETLYLTSYDAKNEYVFEEVSVGKRFVLSVLPASSYELSKQFAASSVTVSVIDGYNVYEGKDLAVIENSSIPERIETFAALKEEKGLTDVNTKAVVFQRDVRLTASDIPSAFTYTVKKPFSYYEGSGADKKVVASYEERTFLRDLTFGNTTFLFLRELAGNESFSVIGNYYSLDLSEVPLVASFDSEEGVGYGSDYSNASLMKICGTDESVKSDFTVSGRVENLNVIGNANRSEWKDENDNPVYAGGLIFLKSGFCKLDIDNVLLKTLFIALFPEFECAFNVHRVKCYDSYQSAGYMWGAATLNISESNFERAGGPLFILTHYNPTTDKHSYPTMHAVDSTLISNVTGSEIWFSSIDGASAIIAEIKKFNALFNSFGKSLTTTANKKEVLNLVCLLMPNGTGTSVISNNDTMGLADITANGKTTTLSRMEDNAFGQTLKSITKQGAPTFNVNTESLLYYNGQTVSWAPNFGSDASYADFVASDHLALNYQGIGLMLGFYAAQA